MNYLFKNTVIKIDGEDLFCENLQIGSSAQMSPIYYKGDKNSFDFALNGINSTDISISYPLTGEDRFKNIIEKEKVSPTSVNINGININAYLKTYSLNVDNFSYLNGEVTLVSFENLTGNITPQASPKNTNLRYLHSSGLSITTAGSEDFSELNSFKLNYFRNFSPVYVSADMQYSGLNSGTSLILHRISEANRGIVCTFSTESNNLSLPITGSESQLSISTKSSDGEVRNIYNISGRVLQKNLSVNSENNSLEITLSQNFIPNVPTVSSMSYVTPIADEYVTIFGSNLSSINQARIGTDIVTSDYLYLDTENLFMRIPDYLNSGDLYLRSDYGEIFAGNLPIRYPSISISNIPNFIVSGQYISIDGDNFSKISRLYFNEHTGEFYVESKNRINAIAPNAIRSGRIIAYSSRGISGISAAYSSPPIITGVTPISGSGIGTEQIRISGYNFNQNTILKFNDLNATYAYSDPTLLTCTIPDGNADGYITAELSSAEKIAYGYENAYIYPTPFSLIVNITGILPTSGKGGDAIRISGYNFRTGLIQSINNKFTVSFGGEKAYFDIVSDRLMTGTLPATAESGPVNICKIDGATFYNTTINNFLKIPEQPVINALYPTKLYSGQRFQGYIAGSNFEYPTELFLTGGNRWITLWNNPYTGTESSTRRICNTSGTFDINYTSATFSGVSRASFNGFLTGSMIQTGYYTGYFRNINTTGVYSELIRIVAPDRVSHLYSPSITATTVSGSLQYANMLDDNNATFFSTSGQVRPGLIFNFNEQIFQIYRIEIRTHTQDYDGTGDLLNAILYTGNQVQTSGLFSAATTGAMHSINFGFDSTYLGGKFRPRASKIIFTGRNNTNTNIPLMFQEISIYGIPDF